ncbi:SphA family protein [Aquabacterium sp.]|uniref:SphA family protein n=1 Tax=Aquabacterium sp. TaxID=1872578 RepID=UPI002BB318F1|nr:transporter [Aquabacterium sp.]HSW05630.1 transporter [Aquabacterium sp.]
MTHVSLALQPGIALAAAACLSCTPSFATEGGGSAYPNGAENFLLGVAPPPGTYVLAYGSYDRLDKLRDKHGDEIPVPFKVGVGALVPRFIWIGENKVLGGNFGFHGFLPLLSIDAKIAGFSQRKTGLGDIIVGPFLTYHPSDKLHYVLAVDVHAPTASYDKTDLVNLGRNHWTAGPVAAISYTQASGINADIKLHYEFNRTNKDTAYRSGQEFHFDYALGWGLGNGWTAGASGYVYQQTTNDEQAGTTVANAKGRALAIGPSLKYQSASGFFVTAKWQQDYAVRNRPEGAALKVKMILPF